MSGLTDNCPECLTGPAQPRSVDVGPTSVSASFRCPHGHTWTTSWDLSALAPGDLTADPLKTRRTTA